MKSTSSQAETPRALLTLIIVMGVMIVIGVAVIVATLIVRHRHAQGVPRVNDVHTVLSIGRGAHLERVAAGSDGSIILQVAAPDGVQRVLLWQPATGRVRAQLELTP